MKEEKKYTIRESVLIDLLEASNRLYALESGGVDNWEWYGASLCDYLEKEGVEDFMELARQDLKLFLADE